MIEINPASSSQLMACLRQRTRDAHLTLERALGLAQRFGDRQWMARLLERFYGFHSVWEPAVIASDPSGFAAARQRLALIEGDLKRLGRTHVEIQALPRCRDASCLTGTRPDAVGSLYVLEGSTLGGQIITRGLKDAGWQPSEVPRYFNPYGKETAERWRAFPRWAADQIDRSDHAAAAETAQRTFAILKEWLTPVR